MKKEIIIKNYSFLFNSFSPLVLFLGYIVPLGAIWKYANISFSGGDTSPILYIAFIALAYMINIAYKKLHGFKLNPPVFIINDQEITIDYFVDNYKFRNVTKKDLGTVSSVKFILNAETNPYGIVNKHSLIKRLFKEDIGNGFIELLSYCLRLISFFFIYMPIKVIILIINKEHISLLKKNFLIEFNDDTACVINIYSESDYKEIYSLLQKNQISIDNSMVLSINLK